LRVWNLRCRDRISVNGYVRGLARLNPEANSGNASPRRRKEERKDERSECTVRENSCCGLLGKRTRSYSSECSDFSGIPYRPTAATWKSSRDFETSTLQRNKVDLLSHTERKALSLSLSLSRSLACAIALDSTQQPELDLNLIRYCISRAFLLSFFPSSSLSLRDGEGFLSGLHGELFSDTSLCAEADQNLRKLNNSFLSECTAGSV
jgi:hypothetical protein